MNAGKCADNLITRTSAEIIPKIGSFSVYINISPYIVFSLDYTVGRACHHLCMRDAFVIYKSIRFGTNCYDF